MAHVTAVHGDGLWANSLSVIRKTKSFPNGLFLVFYFTKIRESSALGQQSGHHVLLPTQMLTCTGK